MDAHPSPHSGQPTLLQLVQNRQVHFVCLTHPHADHGRGLIPVLQEHPHIAEFWSTIYDIPALIYGIGQTVSFPSPVREFATEMNEDWGAFLLDLFGAVAERSIPRHHLRGDQRERTIDGVEVHCIGPEESVQNAFTDAYKEKLRNPAAKVPDPNSLSAILVLKYGQSTILLGADALKKNWESAARRYSELRLPQALVLKVPHHGALNALNRQSTDRKRSYLDICSRNPRAKAVLFAGDSKHPSPGVYRELLNRSQVFCLSNGTRHSQGDTNPLGLRIAGARAVRRVPVCNPVVSFELDTNGNVAVLSGRSCDGCPFAD